MVWACGKYGEEDSCIQGLGLETWEKVTIGTT